MGRARWTHLLLVSIDSINWSVSPIFALLLPPLFEQMLAKQNSRELALQDGNDASERHGKARIEVTTCHIGDQNELVGSGSDEQVMNGSNESVFLRRLSTESDGTLPRQFSEL